MGNDFFSKVFLINLENRKDRLEVSDCALKEQGIEYERWEAIKDDNGIKGLVLTMKALFKHCIDNNYERCLILEDDFKFLLPNARLFIAEVLPQLPNDFYTFHLGLNLLTQPKRISQNILRVDTSYATHAIGYSRAAMILAYTMLSTEEIIPFDIFIRDVIQPYGRSYCTMPMLATQHTNYSDIEKREVDWALLMGMTFSMHTKPLQSMNEIAYCIGQHQINGTTPHVEPTIMGIQHPELIGSVCDCRKFLYGEAECGCAIKEWRVSWKENLNA